MYLSMYIYVYVYIHICRYIYRYIRTYVFCPQHDHVTYTHTKLYVRYSKRQHRYSKRQNCIDTVRDNTDTYTVRDNTAGDAVRESNIYLQQSCRVWLDLTYVRSAREKMQREKRDAKREERCKETAMRAIM